MIEIKYRDLIKEVENNPILLELLTEKRDWGVFPDNLWDEMFYDVLEGRIDDLNHVFSMETPNAHFQYFVVEFGNGDSIMTNKPDLFHAKNFSTDYLIENIYETSSEAGIFGYTIHGYRKKDEKFLNDRCGRQALTDKLGVQTTFVPLITNSEYRRDLRANVSETEISQYEPSLRFNPTKYSSN